MVFRLYDLLVRLIAFSDRKPSTVHKNVPRNHCPVYTRAIIAVIMNNLVNDHETSRDVCQSLVKAPIIASYFLYNLEAEGLFPPVRIFLNLFLRAGYFFNAFD